LFNFDYLNAQRGLNGEEEGTLGGCEETQQLQDVPLGGINDFRRLK
jgi:hypothetical protein